MPYAIVIVSFFVVFAADPARGQRRAEVRRGAAQEEGRRDARDRRRRGRATVETNGPEGLEPENPSAVSSRLLSRCNVSTKHAQAQIQQAGLDWTVGKLLLADGRWAPAIGRGARGSECKCSIMPALELRCAGAGVAAVCRTCGVLHKRSKRLQHVRGAVSRGAGFSGALHARGPCLLRQPGDAGGGIAGAARPASSAQVFNEQNLGAPIDVALQNLAKRVPLLDVSFFVSAVLLQKETGGNLSEILTKLVLRHPRAIQAEGAGEGGQRARPHHRHDPDHDADRARCSPCWRSRPGYLQGMAKDSDGKWLIVGRDLRTGPWAISSSGGSSTSRYEGLELRLWLL